MAHRGGSDGNYEQRVWKVSKALDRLAVMCEQHRRQTKHVDGLPDWTTPSMPAGVKTHDHGDVPANFAWETSTPMAKSVVVTRDDRYLGTPSASVVETQYVPAEETLFEENVDDEPLEQRSEALRASSRSMLSRLSMSSTDSFDISRGQSTREAVRPLHVPREVADMKLTAPASTSYAATDKTHHLDEGKTLRRGPVDSPRISTSVHNLQGTPHTGTTRTATPRHALEPHRRRKVHFADQGQSYRGSRGKGVTDLTYPEALKALASKQATTRGEISRGGLTTTYMQTYQWPTREQLENMMDKVGGQTAGGQSRYEPRRVLTVEDAMRVAKESAVEFKQPGESKPQSTEHYSVVTSEGATDPDTDSPVVNDHVAMDVPKPQLQVDKFADMNSVGAQSNIALTPPILTEKHNQQKEGTPGTTLERNNASREADSSQGLIASPREVLKDSKRDVASPRLRSPVTVNTSTQTDPPKKLATHAKLHQTAAIAQHVGYCSHCGRSGEPTPVVHRTKQTTAKLDGSATRAESGTSKKTGRSIRTAPQSHRINPIFTNTRYPPEPPVSRWKTTYSSEYGTKHTSRR